MRDDDEASTETELTILDRKSRGTVVIVSYLVFKRKLPVPFYFL